jgi:DNA-binding LacI/PurR family transcriptional regulator
MGCMNATPLGPGPATPSNPSGAGDAERRPESRPVSIRQVAAHAGVSIATVSRVMNKSADVSAETAARVRKAVDELGYVPNPMARGLNSGDTRVLGIALPWFQGEFFTELLQGADEEAVRLGYHLMVTSITTMPDGKRRNRIVGSRLVEGTVLMIEKAENPLWRDAIESGLPTVAVVTDLTTQGLDSVVIDNEKGTAEAVEHLLRWMPPSHVCFAGGPSDNYDSQKRAAAFRAALARHGHTATPDQVIFGDFAVEWGREWFLRQAAVAGGPAKLAGSGVLAGNDEIAVGIMRAAEAAKLSVPDQFRIVGFDDTQLSRMIRPSLSTVALQMADVGATAISMLVRRIENKAAPATLVKVPTHLVTRESSTALA